MSLLKYFCVAVLLCSGLVLVSCDDLESVIDTSKNTVQFYGDSIYWDGYKIGYFDEMTRGKDYENMSEVLKSKGLWVERSVKLPDEKVYYTNNKGALVTTIVSGKIISTSLKIARIYNYDLKMNYVSGLLAVPGIGKYCYLYNVRSKELKEIDIKVADEDSSNTVWKNILSRLAGKELIPKYSMYESERKNGLDYISDFNARKKITLKNDTISSPVTIHAAAGLDLYYFLGIRDSNTEGGSANTYLDLHVKPFSMKYLNLELYLPYLFFSLDYKYKDFNGGMIVSGSETRRDLGKKSYLLDFATGFFGFESGISIQKWNLGEAKYYISMPRGSRKTNYLYEKIPFVLEKRQIDILYHPLWRDISRLGGSSRVSKVWDFYGGGRYMSFDRPAIIYKTKTSTIGVGEDAKTEVKAVGESLPQNITLSTMLFGAGANNYEVSSREGFNYVLGFDLYFGKGKTKAYLNESYSELPRRSTIKYGAMSTGGNLGGQFNFKNDYVSVSFKLLYGYDCYVLFMPNSYTTDYDTIIFHKIAISAELFI